MHWKNGMAQGFALFSHGAAAGQAIQTINGLIFDDGVVSVLDTSARLLTGSALIQRRGYLIKVLNRCGLYMVLTQQHQPV